MSGRRVLVCLALATSLQTGGGCLEPMPFDPYAGGQGHADAQSEVVEPGEAERASGAQRDAGAPSAPAEAAEPGDDEGAADPPAEPGTPAEDALDTTCNGRDDDGDGQTDEDVPPIDLVCPPAEGEPPADTPMYSRATCTSGVLTAYCVGGAGAQRFECGPDSGPLVAIRCGPPGQRGLGWFGCAAGEPVSVCAPPDRRGGTRVGSAG